MSGWLSPDSATPPKMSAFSRYLPILDWGRRYDRQMLTSDLVAAAIVTIMLIPQSLAYAMLAGLPPEIGLYASILPIIAYAILGTSRTLAVGPVAVVSLMTLAAAGSVAAPGSAEFIAAALILALLSGLILVVMGVLRLGFLGNLLSHPVVSGFITASGIIIATSQLKSILGIAASGEALPELITTLVSNLGDINLPTLVIGVTSAAFLFWVRKGLKPLLMSLGLAARPADLIAKAGPIAAVAASTIAVIVFDLEAKGVKVVGSIPQSLPPFTVPLIDLALWQQLAVPALLIAVIGFVESVSVAQTLAAKRRQRINPDQELIGLGAANVAAAFSGGYPVTGGFARSVVNFDAGAETPAAGAFTAVGILIAALLLTPLLYALPIATLAATIIVAVLSLVDFKTPLAVWRFSKSDFAALITTIAVTLLAGVEPGVVSGVVLSLALYLWRASRPPRGHRRAGPGHSAFPQCEEAFRNHESARPDDPHRREPDLPQRPLAGGVCAGAGGRTPGPAAPCSDVFSRERDRCLRAGKSGSHQPSHGRCGRPASPVRGQGPCHGRTATLASAGSPRRQGFPVPAPGL
ncbi:MAG: hypothetical protein LW852_03535 [Sediminibacterium sp.]|nr:hypothetical protein [Sediminibacterium sp.]